MSAAQPSSAPQLLIVAGPGRSGTSLFSGLTSRLGLYIPKPEVAANRSNPKGFGEPRWAVDFHNRVLAEANVVVDDGRPEAWDSTGEQGERPEIVQELRGWLEEQFACADRVVVKDPRVAWFFSLYRQVTADLGAQVRVVTMLRDPAEVLRSRELAYGTRTDNVTRMIGWVNMMLGLEVRTRDLPRATIRYDDLLADWRGALTAADHSLGMGLLEHASAEQADHAGELVDPDLRRSVVSWDDLGLGRHTQDLAARVYDTFGQFVGADDAAQAQVQARLDALREEFFAFYDEGYLVARHRTGATVRAERREAAAKVREELQGQHQRELAELNGRTLWRRVAARARRTVT